MDLWIRSQDREKLVKVNDIAIDGRVIVGYFEKNTEYENLGYYNSKERALEVLDEIQNILEPTITIRTNENLNNINNTFVYKMPKE